ncbi:molybdopterin-synthase adenylyltransferase MoeB [Paraglaciecola sp.]|uniref:molybdopterin-synthase adenylyltransferase MoeB n=1 Tax=Paraglaciecola sp. TaxID=1920173 RepID=UPI0030F41BE0
MPTPSSLSLSTQQAMRYSRQILIAGFDLDKQEKLLSSRVLLIGAGGLGCAAAQYLVAAGIGQLTIVDDDKVEISNLQRQVLHSEHDLGSHKSQSAQETLVTLNSEVRISALVKRLSDTELHEQLLEHDIVLDCSDNLTTRKQLNRWCFATQTPLISGAAIRMEGQLSSFIADPDQACYQCLSVMFGEQNLSCMEAGIMSPVVGIIGAMQALEAIKILTGFGKPLVNKLLMFDGMTSEWRSFNLAKNPECMVCSTPNLNKD